LADGALGEVLVAIASSCARALLVSGRTGGRRRFLGIYLMLDAAHVVKIAALHDPGTPRARLPSPVRDVARYTRVRFGILG
jgi:hypothetical protein